MALSGVIVVTTSGNAVAFGSDTFRATSLYVYNLTAGNSLLLDVTHRQLYRLHGAALGDDAVPEARGITGFSVIASTAAGSANLSYLASR